MPEHRLSALLKESKITSAKLTDIYLTLLKRLDPTLLCFFFSSRRRHTRWPRDWSSDVCSSDLCGRDLRGHSRYGPAAARWHARSRDRDRARERRESHAQPASWFLLAVLDGVGDDMGDVLVGQGVRGLPALPFHPHQAGAP